MVTIKELKERKKELCYSNQMISDISGVPVSTVRKIFGGSTETPRYETLLKLYNALFPADRELRVGDPYYSPGGGRYCTHVAEPLEAYAYDAYSGYDKNFSAKGKKQGQYSIKDLNDLPDSVRMELIDGVLYDMASPTTVHQAIILQVFMQIAPALQSAEGDCEVFAAPLDVRFNADDDKTQVQPDLFIVCDKDKYINETERILGAPDMVVEVISPSTRFKDMFVKLHKYGQEGVKECWIVDPVAKTVLVYYYKNGFAPKKYTFEDRVPVNIFDGRIAVNFAAVDRYLARRLGYDPKDPYLPDDDNDGDDDPDGSTAA